MNSTAISLAPLAKLPDTEISIPGSKSQTNRALLCAALSEGTSLLRRFLFADDTEAMLATLRTLGVAVKADEASQTVEITGRGAHLNPGPLSLNVRQSGTTGRFILPLLTLGAGTYELDGHAQLQARPMKPLVDSLKTLGATLSGEALPITVQGGGVDKARCHISGAVSSQFLSGLMLSAPAWPRGAMIDIEGVLVSKPYIDLTAATMASFGVTTEIDKDYKRVQIPPQKYVPSEILLEPDASAASYFFAAAAVTGGKVRIHGFDKNTVQGDLEFVQLLSQMGAKVTYGHSWVEVEGAPVLKGISVDMESISDTAQTLAVVATFADSPTEVSGIGFIRQKETDRIAAVVTQLNRRGIRAEETSDGFIVYPGHPKPGLVETYDDHRMAMSFSLLGLCHEGIEIQNPACVAKTFPRFFEVLDELRS